MEEIYKEMYYQLFAEVSEVIERLIKKQQELEEMFINQDDENV